MASVKPPKHVRAVLVALQSRDYPAYLVGGCVRDMLLGVRAQSWDICTGAQPEQIAEVFPDACRPGARSDAVTVLIDSHELEVTSFRSSSLESGSGEPDMVRFIGDLEYGKKTCQIGKILLVLAALGVDMLISSLYDKD